MPYVKEFIEENNIKLINFNIKFLEKFVWDKKINTKKIRKAFKKITSDFYRFDVYNMQISRLDNIASLKDNKEIKLKYWNMFMFGKIEVEMYYESSSTTLGCNHYFGLRSKVEGSYINLEHIHIR